MHYVETFHCSRRSSIIALFTLVLLSFVLIVLFGIDDASVQRYAPSNASQPGSTTEGYLYRYNRTSSMNAIAFLTPGTNYADLASRISQIDRHIPDKYKSDILIFHTNYPKAVDIKQVVSSTQRQVIFKNVDEHFTRFPDGFDPYKMEPNWSIKEKWNYQHMIRFWFKGVFQLPIIQRYDYLMRLDSDARIPVPWLDMFDLMQQAKAVYFANNEETDFERVLPGTMKLENFTKDYMNHMKIIPKDPKQFWKAFVNDSVRMYWNNFEINQVSFFQQANVRNWTEAIDQSWGIYKYRWGDAVLRYLTLSLFASDDQILHRTKYNLEYCHPC